MFSGKVYGKNVNLKKGRKILNRYIRICTGTYLQAGNMASEQTVVLRQMEANTCRH
jgi:hypothetical protein